MMKLQSSIIPTIIISFLLVAASFFLQGHLGINLADEGFLWYGAISVKAGGIPIRDFQSYDPGRYYWSALWMTVLGDGIIPLRVSAAIFQFIGLSFGLLSLRRVLKSHWLLALAGLIILLWMYPRHKLFDVTISLTAIYFATLLLEKPSLFRHFLSGIFIGFAAFFGRNHGFYTFVAFLCIIFLTWYNKMPRGRLTPNILGWIAGIIIGFSPFLIMAVFIPGFFTSFMEQFIRMISYGKTNLPLEIPWPWSVDYSSISIKEKIQRLTIGAFFLTMPIILFVSLIYILTKAKQKIHDHPVFIASVFIGCMYMHYAFSRADLGYLALGIHPLLIGIIAMPVFGSGPIKNYRTVTIIALLVLTFSSGIPSLVYDRRNFPEKINVRGDQLFTDEYTANVIHAAEGIARDLVPQNEKILIAPHWPTLYAVLGRDAPLWEIYLLLPCPQDLQFKFIKQLEATNTRWVILGDVKLDNRESLRFRNTHNLLWEHIHKNFRPVSYGGLPKNYQLLKRV